MTGSEGTEARRPMRAAGIVLLGLALVAALIGLIVVLLGGVRDTNEEPGAALPTVERTPLPTPTQPETTPDPSPSPSPQLTATDTASPTPTPAPTGDPGSAAAPGDPGPAASAPTTGGAPAHAAPGAGGAPSTAATAQGRGELRVYNNSTIRGLAARAGQDFTAAGWTVVEVGNYSAGTIPTSTVYYREGTDERRIAEALGAEFGLRVEPRFPGLASARPGVIVIVTKDYRA